MHLIFFVTISLFSIGNCQNCMFSSRPITLTQSINETESLSPDPIESLKIYNLAKNQKDMHYGCEDKENSLTFVEKFVRVSQLESEQNELNIYLDTELSNIIDNHKIKECVVRMRILCTDSRHKNITIIIPLQDEDTNEPQFESKNYTLLLQYPWLDLNIPLNYNETIRIIDQDRDFENTGIYEIFTNNTDIDVEILKEETSINHTYSMNLYFKNAVRDYNETTFQILLTNIGSKSESEFNNAEFTIIYSKMDISLPKFEKFYYETYINIYKENEHYNGITDLNVCVEASSLENESNNDIFFKFECNSEKISVENCFMRIDEVGNRCGEISISGTIPSYYVNNLTNGLIDIFKVKAFDSEESVFYSEVPLVVHYILKDKENLTTGSESSSTETLSTISSLPTTDTMSTQLDLSSTETMTTQFELTSTTQMTNITESSTSFTTPVSVSEDPWTPLPYVCVNNGSYEDSYFYNVFHICSEDDQGGYNKIRHCCQKSLKFCQDETADGKGRCLYDDEIKKECSHKNFNDTRKDETCDTVCIKEYETIIDDTYCNVYHECKPRHNENGFELMRLCCPKDQVFCVTNQTSSCMIENNSVENIICSCGEKEKDSTCGNSFLKGYDMLYYDY